MTTFLFFASALIFSVGLGFGLGVLSGLAVAACTRGDHIRADEKGISLLRSWLSPEQATLWDSHKHFCVVGSDTGRRYRIRRGTSMNIDELDPAGNKVCAWCFVPKGNLVAGDCMLAQKIALETFESEALATANRNGGFRLAPSRTTGRETKVPAATAR
jgi:hypothetical protein